MPAADHEVVLVRPPGTESPSILVVPRRTRRRGPRSAEATARRSRCHGEIPGREAAADLPRSQACHDYISPGGAGEAGAPPSVFSDFIIEHLNIRGFVSHKTELEGHLKLSDPKPHILLLNETHLTKLVNTVELSGYVEICRLDRRDGRSHGGIAIFCLQCVFEAVTFLEHAEDLSHERAWFAIHADVGPFLLCAWYRPPCPGEISSINAFCGEWSRLSSKFVGTVVIGDVNVHHKHWLRHSNGVSVEGTRLYRFCCDNGFRQLVRKATHTDGNLLDLVLTDSDEVSKVKVGPLLADHNFVRVSLELSVPFVEPRRREVFDFAKANWTRIRRRIEHNDWNYLRTLPVDIAAGVLTRQLLDFVGEFTPVKTLVERPGTHPWLNDKCLELIQAKRRAEGTDNYKEVAAACSQGIFEEFLVFVKSSRNRLRRVKRGSKFWWRLSAQLMDRSKSRSGIPALKHGDEWILDSAGKANRFETVFSAKCMLPDEQFNEFSIVGWPMVSDVWLRVRPRREFKVLLDLDESSGTGPDMLGTKILKRCASVLALPIAILVRSILVQRRWPTIWTQHWVCPLYKRKSVYDADNYRGVHLTSQLSKVVERVLAIFFIPRLDYFSGDCQFAYRKGRGARDAVALYVLSWINLMNGGWKIGIYCSDVAGAFDRVSSARLLDKLACVGLPASILGVIRSWLRERGAHVIVGGVSSRKSLLRDMVFQGTVWGSSLWNLFFSDARFAVEGCGFVVVVYADDFNAFKPFPFATSNDTIFADLRECQLELHRWGHANQVTFDAGKESFAVISTTDPAGESFKLLGLEFDTKLVMRDCVRICVTEASWRYRSILRTHRFFNDRELVGLFKAHVLSYVEYRTPGVYHASTTVLEPLDRILSSFLRQVNVDELAALHDLNLAPLSARRDVAMLGLLHRAVLKQGPRQFQQMFQVSRIDYRRSARYARHDKQIVCGSVRSGNELCIWKRSAFGLSRVYNLLPSHVVECKSIHEFQSAAQSLVKRFATQGHPQWHHILSPRLALPGHPLLSV